MSLDRYHALTTNNRDFIFTAGGGVCVHCGHQDAAVTFDWIDNGHTAMCPSCGVDAVIPLPTPTLLARLRQRWFKEATANDSRLFKDEPG